MADPTSDGVDDHTVTFNSGDVTLAGTLVRPLEPAGSVLFLNGSGPLDRDSNIDGQRLEIANTFAHELALAGWASLRFDKRGVGASTGDALTGGFHDEIADAEAALDALTSAVGGPTVVIGHSVGGTVAARLAAQHDLDGVVFLATPAQALSTVAPWQTERIAETLPGPAWLAPAVFRAAQRRGWRSIERSTGDTIRGVFRRQPARWFREALAYDTRSDLGAITCPVLAVTGRKDLQVDSADVERIGDSVRGSFRGDVSDDLTHLLRREDGNGGILSYRRQLKRPVDPALVDAVVGWVSALTLDP